MGSEGSVELTERITSTLLYKLYRTLKYLVVYFIKIGLYSTKMSHLFSTN